METVAQRLKQLLSLRKKRCIINPDLVSAAVLVPVVYRAREPHILFTVRTEKVRDHKGEVSFPGGSHQEEDGTLLNTALRECAEEIGFGVGEVKVLGELDDVLTFASGYIITPFVAFVSDSCRYRLSRDEVEEIIEIPFSSLHGKREQNQGAIAGSDAVYSSVYHYQGQVIWGATARILDQFLPLFARASGDE